MKNQIIITETAEGKFDYDITFEEIEFSSKTPYDDLDTVINQAKQLYETAKVVINKIRIRNKKHNQYKGLICSDDC